MVYKFNRMNIKAINYFNAIKRTTKTRAKILIITDCKHKKIVKKLQYFY